jgi:hypothetical protein
MPKECGMQVPRQDTDTNALGCGIHLCTAANPIWRVTGNEGGSIVHSQPQIEGQRVWRKAAPVVQTRKYRFFFITNT